MRVAQILKPRVYAVLALMIVSSPLLAASPHAHWIAPATEMACPTNAWMYLRRVVRLDDMHGDKTLQLAADSNAHVWINGNIVRRKVTRFYESTIATETIDARPFLHPGDNTVVILLHTWGPIVSFQRDGCTHAGVYVSSSWVVSDGEWRTHQAEEFAANDEQIVGMPAGKGAHRIRFAQFVEGARMPGDTIFESRFDDSRWQKVQLVRNGPWPEKPLPTGVPGQREEAVRPVLLLAQGESNEAHVGGTEPVRIEKGILNATLHPAGPQAIPIPRTLDIQAEAGETKYITVDFGRPVHGYPFITASVAGSAPVIDFAYGELSRSPLTGELLTRPDGWINPEAIVGEGYIDRYTATSGVQHVELPDERTARWWTLHLFFPAKGTFQIKDLGFTSSQYPVEVRGSFNASDPRVTQIVQLSLEHAIVSMSDTYVDTPGREDGQWLEDARLRGELASQWFGDVKLRQVFLRLVAESQRPDGTFHPFPPSNYPIVSNADWVMEWVGALYDDYLWTGETARIDAYWPQVEAFWNNVLAQVSPSGLWVESRVFADIRIGIHPDKGQSSGIATAQLIDRLNLSIEMAKAAGHIDDAARWQDIHDRMLTSFQQDHIVKATGTIPAHVDDVADPEHPTTKRGFSQAAQAMAVDAGLLPAPQAKSDLQYAFTRPDGVPPTGVDRWNNPTYLYRALDSLSSVGLSDLAAHHLIERFSPYLPGDRRNPVPPVLQGKFGGPLPEYWISREDLGLAPGTDAPSQPIDASGSHGWNSVGLVWLHKRLLGVSIKAPGGGLISVQPDAADFARVEGTTMTPHGAVHVSWNAQNEHLKIDLPTQVTADILLPAPLAAIARAKPLHVPVTCERSGEGKYRCTGSSLVFSPNESSHSK